ncbi:MAG: ferrous iron transport protein A [Burkholderiales bacterium]|nr:ferrous iron transport protein A [Burkholderiales bacterium]MDE2395673.1 ferrous iron transport protein A [Burkholderiales bacterium]MDE2452635.1 ferrous iron transport protein A [Burkholderiales bacterium]
MPRGGGALARSSVCTGALALDGAATGQACRVVAVESPAGLPEWGRWLAEIGFMPGERVAITARSAWGGDPMVVRVGQSTFALRRAEAACVRVEPV